MKFRELKAQEIEVRPAMVKENGVALLLYKDARVDQRILDETVGAENWQRSHDVINGKLFCRVGIRIERGDMFEWVWKQDVGVPSNTEPVKGEASDSFKRACTNWGIGRELYTAPFIWAEADVEQVNNKWTTYDRFYVEDIVYNDGSIVALSIKNQNNKRVFLMDNRPKEDENKNDKNKQKRGKD